MALVTTPKDCSPSVKKAIQQLSKKLGPQGNPTYVGLTLSKICTVAAGLNVLRVTGLQTDGVAMTGTLRGAYIDVSNGSTAATGTIRALELKARTEAPGDTGNNVAVLEGLSISADSKAHDVTTMRAAEFILDGKTAGTIDEAVGLRIANNLQVDKATLSYGLQIYRDSFDYTYDISLSLGGHITGDSYVNQDLRTTASPTFANLSLGTGELTAGSINRAAGTLTLEIAGTAEISISSTTVTLGGNLVIPDTGYIGSTSDTNAIQIAASGEVTFTDVITGILPTAGAHLATKEYVDLAVGASADFFLSDNDDAVIADYHILYDTDTGEASSTLATAAMDEGDNQLMFSYVTASGVPGVTFLRNGVYVLHTHLARTTGNRPTLFYWTLSKYETDTTETVLMTSEVSSAIPGSMASFVTHAILTADEVINDTDRLVLKLHANITGGGANSVITIYMEGTHDCHLTNQLPSSIWQNQGDVLDDLNATGVNTFTGDPVNDFLVGTAAGTLVWQYGATARTSMGVGTGDSPQFTGIELGHANDTTITRVSAGVIAVQGVNVMMVGGAPTAHVHDGDTLQLDAINSNAGSFAFDTGGLVTFNEAITMSAGKDLTIAGHIIFNTNNSYIGFTNPKITFNDTSDQIEITGGLTGTSTAAFAGASVTIGTASTTTGTLVLHDSGSANTITLTVPNALAGSLSFTLPPTDGANTNVLQTNGSGVLTWVAAGGGASTWIALTDTDPANYTGQAGNTVVVNVGEDGLEFGAAPGGAFTSKCSVYRNATQAIATITWTKVQLNTEDYDTDGEFDSTTNYRFQPATTGYYHVSGAVSIIDLTDTGTIYAAIYKTGSLWKISSCTLGAVAGITVPISCDIYLLSTDYVELFVYHNHGSNRNVGGANRYTFMDVHRFA